MDLLKININSAPLNFIYNLKYRNKHRSAIANDAKTVFEQFPKALSSEHSSRLFL
jgi:hypothetical protein